MKNVKIILVAVVCLALIGGGFYFFTHRQGKSPEDEVEVTELDEVLSKQLDESYPPTPREVVKFYNRIIECAYSGGYTDDQFEQLTNQAQKLMDEELLQENPLDTYRQKLKEEVATYDENSQEIIRTSVCSSDEVIKKTIDGRECAYVSTTYFIRTKKSQFDRTYQEYLLRQDDAGNWKILAYYLAEGKGDND